MIKVSDGKIGTREFTAMIILSIGIKGTDTTPDLLIFSGKNASWLMPIVSMAVLIVPFLLLLSLIKKHRQGLIEIAYLLAGRSFGFLVGFVLFLLFFIGTAINSRSYADIYGTMFYQVTPVPYLFVLLLAASCMVAIRGFETIGRTSWLVIGMLIVIGLALLAFVWQEADWYRVFPLLGPGPKHLIAESAATSSIFIEILLFTAFFPYVRSYENFRLGSLAGFGISSFLVATLIVFYVAVFDYPAVEFLNYPYHQLNRIASVGGTTTHLESIFLGFWVVATVIHFAINLYIIAFIFAKSLRMNEFEPLLMPFAGLIVLLGLLPENIIALNEYRSGLLRISSGIAIAFPCLLWILDRWKGRARA